MMNTAQAKRRVTVKRAACGDSRVEAGPVLPLIGRLCEALREQGVAFCHWKSNWRLERWARGEGDLDLLVERADAHLFAAVAHRLGSKQA